MTTTKPKILVVEDDDDLRELVSDLLEMDGYEIEKAGNGSEALAVVARGLPDLILLDMRMPVMSGWEFAARFHKQYDGKVPIVVMTAAASARSCANEIGATGWVGKPFEMNELSALVKRSVAHGPHAAGAEGGG